MNNAKKTIVGVFWSGIERFSFQGIQFIVQLVLARILLPRDFGLIGMLAVFIALAHAIIDSGFSKALIQKIERTKTDLSTVFYFNIFVSVIIYLIIYISSPFIAKFYNEPELVTLAKVVGLNIVILSFSLVHKVILTIKVDFKTQTKASVIAALVSGFVGVYMAYNGFGVWALVTQSLLSNLFQTLFLWLLVKWIPQMVFSIESLKNMFSFGSKLLITSILNVIMANAYMIVFGKLFTSTQLGYYTRAKQFTDISSVNITSIIQRVSYPVLCEIQDRNDLLKNEFRRFIVNSSYIIFPLMVGTIVLAEPLIKVLLTDKWIAAVPMLQLLCVIRVWYPLHVLNSTLLTVKGKSGVFLKLELLKNLLVIANIALAFPYGIKGILIGDIVVSFLALIVNTYYSKKMIGYGLLKQLIDVSGILLISLVMGGVMLISTEYISGNIFKIIFGGIVGGTIYLGISYIFNINNSKNIVRKIAYNFLK